VISILQWAAIGTAGIVAVLLTLLLSFSWQVSRWFRAEFPCLPPGTVLTEEEEARWKACVDKKRARGIFRSCEIAFTILGLPGLAMRSQSMIAKAVSGWTILACNAIAWFVILSVILAFREFGNR
jgi:hypothetical protein